MRDRIAHRGPDHADAYVALRRQAGLGFRRLSIIDLQRGRESADAERGRLDPGRLQRRDLQLSRAARRPRRARPSVPIELRHRDIVHLYEEHGADCIERLDGMFALAIWDEPKGRLILARDRAGKKPLFYHADPKRVLFASEIKAFLGASRRSRPRSIATRSRRISCTATCPVRGPSIAAFARSSPAASSRSIDPARSRRGATGS